MWGKKKNINNRSSAAIQQLFICTRHIMWKRTRPRIQLDSKWPDLTTGKHHIRLFNGVSAAHSLGHEEHAPTFFCLKNNKYTVKILKHPLILIIIQNTHVNIPKYLKKSLFLSFLKLKTYLKIKKKKLKYSYKKTK